MKAARTLLPALLIAAIAAAAWMQYANAAADDGQSPSTLQACEAVGATDCVTPKPFQPTAEQLKATSAIYYKGDKAIDTTAAKFDPSVSVLVDGLPYYRYWQLKHKDSYVFHAMQFGFHVLSGVDDPAFRKGLRKLLDRVGVPLPNGGIAVYYPKHYPLNRMRGPVHIYSGISQSSILTAFVKNDQLDQSAESHIMLEQIKKGMFFDHDKGGVELSGVAQLELPLFNSNPEIILNGWTHALMQLNDYALIYKDKKAAEYIRKNLRFFADHHEAWYDKKRNISRYSETSPHRSIVQYTDPTIEKKMVVIYKSKVPELHDYAIVPVEDFKNERASFDVRILSVNPKSKLLSLNLTCSGLFDTFVVAPSKFALKVRDGGYSPTNATPIGSGTWHIIKATQQTPQSPYVAQLALDKEELICGYPTNFSREHGKNYYHMHHMISLLYLALTPSFDDPELQKELIAIVKKWYENTQKIGGPGVSVEHIVPPQTVLNSINRVKFRHQFTDVYAMFKQAGITPLPVHRNAAE